MYSPEIARDLPQLKSNNHSITSPQTHDYNCIAWAAGEDDRWWWPVQHPHAYWPPGIPRVETVDAFIQAFVTKGYSPCDDGTLQPATEKVVLYVDKFGKPTHMARQLRSGQWTSKCGPWCDISHHNPDVVAGGVYGTVFIFLARSIPNPFNPSQ